MARYRRYRKRYPRHRRVRPRGRRGSYSKLAKGTYRASKSLYSSVRKLIGGAIEKRRKRREQLEYVAHHPIVV
jgi:hypothetical protein